MYIISHTDPMSLQPGKEEFSHTVCSGSECLEVRFESNENRLAYISMPTEPSTLDFENASGEGIDEG